MSSIHDWRKSIGKAIRSSERFFQTDMMYLVKGGSWLGIGHVITIGVSFLLSVAFANLLPKETYGVYRYVLSVASIIAAFSLTGLSTAIIQSVARGFEGSLRDSFRLSMRWSLPMVIISLIGSGYYFYNDNATLGIALLIVGICSPLLNSAGLFASFINGKKDFRRLSVYSMIDNIIPALILTGTIVITDNILTIIGVYFLSHTVMALVLYFWTLARFKPQPVHDPELKDYSTKLSFLNIISIITTQIDKVLIFTYLGGTELAIYGFAIIFPDQIRGVLKNLNTLMIPKLAEKEAGQPLGLTRKTIQLGIILIVITALYIGAAPFLYGLFFPAYGESVYYSRIFALSIMSALAMIPTAVLIGQKKEKELSRVSIISSVIQLAILFPAVYYMGLLGAILAKIIASYITLTISFIMVQSHYDPQKS